MSLAIFDLDNTLLNGDSDYLWGEFLVEQGLVDGDYYQRENLRFYEQYQQGGLDILAFLRFSLKPLTKQPLDKLYALRKKYIQSKIIPIQLPAAAHLIQSHKNKGDDLLIITATNRFITEPIAALLEIDHLIATSPEITSHGFTGNIIGTPCFQEGKVILLNQWLIEHDKNMANSWFYSDSHNDLPLLQQVTHPVAVDPDEKLIAYAKKNQWQIISLRQGAKATDIM